GPRQRPCGEGRGVSCRVRRGPGPRAPRALQGRPVDRGADARLRRRGRDRLARPDPGARRRRLRRPHLARAPHATENRLGPREPRTTSLAHRRGRVAAPGGGSPTMTIQAADLEGIIPAVAIPMREDESLDLDAYEGYLRWVDEQGIVGLAVNVDTGEGPYLTPDERRSVIET